MFHTLSENVYIKLLNTEDALTDVTYYPASTGFIDVSEFDSFAFVVATGALDTASTFAVYQDISATATGSIKAVSGATVTVGTSGDDKWYTVEVQTNRLDGGNGFKYVTLYVTGPTGNDYAALLFLGFRPRNAPVTQPTGTGGQGSSIIVAG